jgi:hypothetical protein
MLMAHPSVLRNLVERYESLSTVADGTDTGTDQQLSDTVYTLCVSTGTRDITAALVAARARIDDVDTAAA